MWGFPWMFWLVPFLLFVMMTRHGRWNRWATAGRGVSPRVEQELEEQRVYVDGLERRIIDLEERLDFTERLLAQRSKSVS